MTHPREIAEVLQRQLALYRRLLELIEAEADVLRQSAVKSGTNSTARKELLPELNRSLPALAEIRAVWQAADPGLRARHPEVTEMVRETQDLLMRILMLDRENEAALLRHGLVPPRELPSVRRQQPGYVADLYRRGDAVDRNHAD